MASGTRGKVASIGKLWGKARETTKDDRGFGEAVPVDQGKYQMQLVSAEIGDFGGERKVMMKWCVLDEGETRGTICTMWEGVADPDRLVWLQRLLAGLGVDLDEVTIEDEDDLQKVFDELVEAQTVAGVKVVEKDGWTNMRVRSKVDVDSDILVDAEEVLKDAEGGSKKGGKDSDDDDDKKSSKKSSKGDDDDGDSKKSSKKSDPDDDEDEKKDDAVEVAEGDVVEFKHPKTKKTVQGKIEKFDKDDNAMVDVDGEPKLIRVALDELTKVDDEEDDKKSSKKDDDDNSKKSDERELEEGDVVVIKLKGKDKSGVVDKIKKDKVFVKVKGEPKPVEVDIDEVKFAV